MNIQKILDRIIVNENECWIWQKSVTSQGYGQLTEDKKYWTSHTYTYVCEYGEIPEGQILRHTCHQRRCCNPRHLIPGTHKKNYNDSKNIHEDAAKKRRSAWIIMGVEYETCREIRDLTGLSMNSIIKYTKNNVFDVESYRAACKISRKIPKI